MSLWLKRDFIQKTGGLFPNVSISTQIALRSICKLYLASVIYCISGAITFGGRNSVRESRGSRNCPKCEISKTFLNPAWFPETCNRDSCWPGSDAEERGVRNPRLGSDLEVGTWDFLHAAKPKPSSRGGRLCRRPLRSLAQRSSRAPKAIGEGVCWLCLIPPCFFPCKVRKGRPLPGNLGWKITRWCMQVPEELSQRGAPSASRITSGGAEGNLPLRRSIGLASATQRKTRMQLASATSPMLSALWWGLCTHLALPGYPWGCGTIVLHHLPRSPLKEDCDSFAQKRDDFLLESLRAFMGNSHLAATPAYTLWARQASPSTQQH